MVVIFSIAIVFFLLFVFVFVFLISFSAHIVFSDFENLITRCFFLCLNYKIFYLLTKKRGAPQVKRMHDNITHFIIVFGSKCFYFFELIFVRNHFEFIVSHENSRSLLVCLLKFVVSRLDNDLWGYFWPKRNKTKRVFSLPQKLKHAIIIWNFYEFFFKLKPQLKFSD